MEWKEHSKGEEETGLLQCIATEKMLLDVQLEMPILMDALASDSTITPGRYIYSLTSGGLIPSPLLLTSDGLILSMSSSKSSISVVATFMADQKVPLNRGRYKVLGWGGGEQGDRNNARVGYGGAP